MSHCPVSAFVREFEQLESGAFRNDANLRNRIFGLAAHRSRDHRDAGEPPEGSLHGLPCLGRVAPGSHSYPDLVATTTRSPSRLVNARRDFDIVSSGAGI